MFLVSRSGVSRHVVGDPESALNKEREGLEVGVDLSRSSIEPERDLTPTIFTWATFFIRSFLDKNFESRINFRFYDFRIIYLFD